MTAKDTVGAPTCVLQKECFTTAYISTVFIECLVFFKSTFKLAENVLITYFATSTIELKNLIKKYSF
jgi:hypothetical protein